MVLCPFPCFKPSSEPTPPDFDPNDGTWLWVTDYGAAGDGTTDDSDAVQGCIDAAAAQGKNVYLPPGSYGCYAPYPANGMTVRGAGPSHTTVQSLYDYGDGGTGWYLANRADVVLRGFSLAGPTTNGHMDNSQGIYMGNSHRITIQDVWLDGWCYGFRSDSGGSQVGNYDISLIDCKTLSHNCTGYLAAVTYGLTITGCDFDSDTVDNRADGPGPSHHFYFNNNVQDVTISNTTFRNGVSYSWQIYDGAGNEGFTCSGLTFIDVEACMVINPGSAISIDGMTGSSARYLEVPWFSISGSSDITVANFELAGGTALVGTSSSTGIVFQDGTYDGPSLGGPATFTNVSLI